MTTKKVWLPDRLPDGRTTQQTHRWTDRHRQTDTRQSDPYVSLCFAGDPKMVAVLVCSTQLFILVCTSFYNSLEYLLHGFGFDGICWFGAGGRVEVWTVGDFTLHGFVFCYRSEVHLGTVRRLTGVTSEYCWGGGRYLSLKLNRDHW